jgi:hypothetical protein
MHSTDAIKAEIREAFAGAVYPGDGNLRGSSQGDEPFLLEAEFSGKTDWRTLDAAFIDRAPDGFGTALHFFSHAAFRFYLPAYLLADLEGDLKQSDPAFTLWYGLDDETKDRVVNARLYGQRTWFEMKREALAVFTQPEAAAIVLYLRWRVEQSAWDDERQRIEAALRNYWLERAGTRTG